MRRKTIKKDKQRNKETKTKASKIVYLQAAKNIPLWYKNPKLFIINSLLKLVPIQQLF